MISPSSTLAPANIVLPVHMDDLEHELEHEQPSKSLQISPSK